MANGYQRGDYLTQFLQQLPQIYQSQQNLQLQRERFEYLKESGAKEQLLLEERNRLARLEFEERQQKNINDQAQRDFENKINQSASDRADYTLQSAAFKPGSEAHHIFLLNQEFIKKNPKARAELDEHWKIQNDLQDRIEASVGMPPLERLPELRTLTQNIHKSPEQFTQIQGLIKGAREEAEITLAEMTTQPSYTKLANERILLQEMKETGPREDLITQTKESPQEFQKRLDDVMQNVQDYELDVMEEARASLGEYPGLSQPFYVKFPDTKMFDNVEDIPNNVVDEVLGGLGSTVVEKEVLPPELTAPDSTITPPAIQTAGFTGPSPQQKTYTEDVLGVPGDVEAVPPEDFAAFMPARDYSPISPEDMKKYGRATAYTGTDAREREEVDFYFDLLKNNDISRKRFFDALKKGNVNMQSIDLGMIYKHKGKPAVKELSKKQKDDIKTILKQIEQLKTRNFDKRTLEDKINRQKNKILKIDPNYKFKN